MVLSYLALGPGDAHAYYIYKDKYYYCDNSHQWENTPITNDVLSAYLTHKIIQIYSTDYYNYHDRLFLIDTGNIYAYDESTHTFELTAETLDQPDLIKNKDDYRIDIEEGFYLYDNSLYHAPYTTRWEAYNEASTDYSKWDEVAVDKELIINSKKYYDEPASIKSGGSSSSDSSYNWDSGSSWDSGATDWNSNW